MNFRAFLEYNLIKIGEFTLNVFQIVSALAILLLAHIFVRFLVHLLKRGFKRRKIEIGRQFAIIQFVKYVIYTISVLLAFQSVGIQLSVLWGGAAALLVGVGLGLQQTFTDLLSGIILLGEAAVEVGDIISIDGLIGKVTSIGLRTSNLETRDNNIIIIPNSKLLGNNVINWSHNSNPTRFHVNVGVSYGSDVLKVTELLLKAATEHPSVLELPKTHIEFNDFGDSSLDFKLHFYSHEYLGIEGIKSDLRYRIIQLFRENNVEIPFPQHDLWIKNGISISRD